MFNANWSRWIFASCAKHFSDKASPYAFFVEGDTDLNEKDRTHAEFRIDGPYTKVEGPKQYLLVFEINILLTAVIDQKDLFNLQTMIGHFTAAFTNGIPVYKYGNETGDNPTTYVGCLEFYRDRNDIIEVHNFGKIEPATDIQQASIEGHYYIRLSGE